jgi:hypothetical protein
MIRSLVTNLRKRPGYISAFTFSTITMGYTFYYAPQLENNIIRYAFAGTAATLFVEVATHALDTINMRAKVINGPKLSVFGLLKIEGVSPLFKGI